MANQKEIFPYELIGKKVKVIAARNKSDLAVEGKIVDETKTTVKVEQQGKIKTIMKQNVTFLLTDSGRTVSGASIVKRPEERLKN